jgi:multifunctional methyltransferase subunit TRM112
MRLLTHNLLKNNAAAAKGNGYPLRIVYVDSIRVDDPTTESDKPQVEFVKNLLPTLHWSGLVQVRALFHASCMESIGHSHMIFFKYLRKAANAVGIHTLPNQLLEDMAEDPAFLIALYHILMNVHVVQGMMECPVTKRQFAIQDEIPNLLLSDEECERVR